MLSGKGIKAQVVNASSVKPLDVVFLQELTTRRKPYYIMEEQVLAGGLGSAVSEYCVQDGLHPPEYIFSLPDTFITQGSHQELLRHCGLDADSIFRRILSMRAEIA